MRHRVHVSRALVVVLACTLAACGDVREPVSPAAIPGPSFARGGNAPTPYASPLELLQEGTDICGFPVYQAFDGKTKTIELPGGRSITIWPQLRGTFVNGNTGTSISFSSTGTGHTNPLPDGGFELVIVGHNPLGLDVDGHPVFSIASGRFTIVFDAAGNVVQPLAGVGSIVDACELLR